MSGAETRVSTGQVAEPAQGSFLPDELSESMVSASSEFFLGGSISGVEQPGEYRQAVHRLYEAFRYDGRLFLAAGLRLARFSIEVAPVAVTPPVLGSGERPEYLLDPTVLAEYGYRVAPTLADMGQRALQKGGPHFNEEIYDEVILKVDRN